MTHSGLPMVIIGAGPAGLFAAERLLQKGYAVELYDQMPAAGCKFLTAGSRGGLNITNAAPVDQYAAKYGFQSERFFEYLRDFSPRDLQNWLSGFGIQTAQGSGGKIFPANVSAAELLSRWMAKLSEFSGFTFFPQYRFQGISDDRRPVFQHSETLRCVQAAAVLLALGGKSWPATGSNGEWVSILESEGITVTPFRSANCGFEIDWSDYQQSIFTYQPLKNISVSVAGKISRGELLLTPYGMEGTAIYTLSADIRDTIQESSDCTIHIDLLPDWSAEKILLQWAQGPGKNSLRNFYRKVFHLDKPGWTLLAGCTAPDTLKNKNTAAILLKAVPVKLLRPRPIEEAISSAGGVSFHDVRDDLMLKVLPGWFCAGEMLDWEAPTGGFLMQGCFSTAYQAAEGMARWQKAGGITFQD